MRIFRYLTRSRTKAPDEPPGLFQDLDGRVWYRKPDSSEVEVGGGGGGSLPAWWTVVSTPGAESVEFAGVARIAPTYSTGVPLTIEALTPGGAQTISEMKSASVAFPSFQVTIDDLGNAAFMLFDENEEEFVKLQTGAFSSFIKPTDVAGIVGLDDASGNGIVEVLGSGMLGFFGTPHVVQQTLGATPTGAEIRAVLVAYGLVAA